MAVYPIPTLLTRISTYITTNGTNDITGAVMHSILTDVVDSLNAIIGSDLTLEDVLTNGNNANGLDINLNGSDASLTSVAGFFGTINALLFATGIVILKSNNDVVNMRNNADFDLTFALTGLTASRQWTIQDKPITVAGLDDIAQAIANLIDSSPGALDTLNELAAALGDDPNFATTVNNSIAARLKLDGTTPMTGDLNMTTNSLAVQTNKIKTAAGLLEWYLGSDKLIHDFSAITGGIGGYTLNWRAKSGVPAMVDDIKNHYFIEHTETSHTGNTTETVLHTIEIPAGTIEIGDLLESYFQATAVGLADVKTFRIYISPNPSLTGAVQIYNFFTNHLNYMILRNMWVGVGSVIKQYLLPTTNTANWFGSGTSGITDTAAIDFTTTKHLVVSVQLADASDSVTLRMSNLQVLKPNN